MKMIVTTQPFPPQAGPDLACRGNVRRTEAFLVFLEPHSGPWPGPELETLGFIFWIKTGDEVITRPDLHYSCTVREEDNLHQDTETSGPLDCWLR